MPQWDSADRVLVAARRLHYLLAADRVLRAIERLIEILRKANFDPNQPRVPRGRREGGQCTRVHGPSDVTGPPRSDPRVISDATPDNDWQPGAQFAQRRPPASGIRVIGGRRLVLTPGQAIRLDSSTVAAQAAVRRVREIDPGWNPRPSFHQTVEGAITANRQVIREADARLRELGQLAPPPVTSVPPIRLTERPSIPLQPPPTTREANKFVKLAARWLGTSSTVGGLSLLVDAGSWIYDHYPYIASYLDPPRTLQELQAAVANPMKGYDFHHIVEQTPAEKDGFQRWEIDSFENLVRIPTLKHWQITGWYNTPDRRFGWLTPREYLRGKDWDERMRIGREALVHFGVLEP